MKRMALGFLAGALIVGGAWGASRLLTPADPVQAPDMVLQVRLAQAEELSPQLKASDSTGAAWARRYEENLPSRTARECGATRFEVMAASDFFQAVRIPISQASEALLHCLVTRGGGYLRFSVMDAGNR